METVEIARFEDTFVIHFGSEFPRINAYTLASSLVGFADAAKAANSTLNPGYDIEIVVEALGSGSFKATIRTIYSGARNLFSQDSLKNIALGVIAAFIYQNTLAPDVEITVNVGEHEVVIEQGDTRIVVPREIYSAVKDVERNPKFREGVGEAIRAIERDEEIRSIGFSPDEREPLPPLPIPRERFANLAERLEMVDVHEREIIETTNLQIVRAILERSRRRWQFVWNGIKIPAPILDDNFYSDFFERRITIAPGDVLRVKLKIKQIRDPANGVFVNNSYEVIEVLDHFPSATEIDLFSGPRDDEGA